MIEFFAVIHEGGFIRWSYHLTEGHAALLSPFLQTVFLEGPYAKDSFIFGELELEWTRENQRQLIFVVSLCRRGARHRAQRRVWLGGLPEAI